MRTRVTPSTDSLVCAAAAMIRLAARRRTPGIRLSPSAPVARTAPTVVDARVYQGGERDLLLNEVPEPVDRHDGQRVGDEPVAHRLVRPARDLAGLSRRGQDRLDGSVDRVAVGDDGSGHLPWADRPGFKGLPLSRHRFRGPCQFCLARHRRQDLRIRTGDRMISSIEDIAGMPGISRDFRSEGADRGQVRRDPGRWPWKPVLNPCWHSTERAAAMPGRGLGPRITRTGTTVLSEA